MYIWINGLIEEKKMSIKRREGMFDILIWKLFWLYEKLIIFLVFYKLIILLLMVVIERKD